MKCKFYIIRLNVTKYEVTFATKRGGLTSQPLMATPLVMSLPYSNSR